MKKWIPAAVILLLAASYAVTPAKIYSSSKLPSYEPSITPSSISVYAGYEYEINITGEERSDEWAGIFGVLDVVATVGSGSYKFYEWVKDLEINKEVLVSYSPDVNFDALGDTNWNLLEEDLNQEIGWYPVDEPVNKTFAFDENIADCSFSLNTIVALLYGDFVDADNNISPEWPVCAYHEGDGGTTARVVFGGKIYPGRAFDGNVADYEVLVAVPRNGNVFVYFWVE